ncbi:hypothetical protein FBU31_006339, partial [Coemansia sp. 'formosensis']
NYKLSELELSQMIEERNRLRVIQHGGISGNPAQERSKLNQRRRQAVQDEDWDEIKKIDARVAELEKLTNMSAKRDGAQGGLSSTTTSHKPLLAPSTSRYGGSEGKAKPPIRRNKLLSPGSNARPISLASLNASAKLADTGKFNSFALVPEIKQQELSLRSKTEALDAASASIWTNLTQANRRRGPDAHDEISTTLPNGEAHINLKFGAHVLHLRGSHTQKQPMVDSESGDIFCWNGEIFDGLDVDCSDNDGALLFDLILKTKVEDPAKFIIRALSKIEGPYAFVYFDREQRKLWFARDYLGRRSLLVNKSCPSTLLISSVADSSATDSNGEESVELRSPVDSNGVWLELPAQRIYCMDLGLATSAESFGSFVEYQWSY